MSTKRVRVEFQEHHFEVVNTYRGGLKLYHNSELLEHNKSLFAVSRKKPIISKTILIQNVERTLEIFVYAIFKVKIQIRIDGEKIAGDNF